MSNVFVIIKMCYVHNQWYDISCATLYYSDDESKGHEMGGECSAITNKEKCVLVEKPTGNRSIGKPRRRWGKKITSSVYDCTVEDVELMT